MPVDLTMWTKNGAKTLPYVLDRINSIVPSMLVNQRIVVDDGSTDQTAKIAKAYGWRVVPNCGKGVSDAANTALGLVQTEIFCSFEQDVVLSPKWLQLLKYMIVNAPSFVAASSGVRFADGPASLTTLQKYVYGNYVMHGNVHGCTLDNTVWRTKALRELGGFPKLPTSSGVDSVIASKLQYCGYRWHVDYSIQSLHIRGGLLNELKHQYWYGTEHPKVGVELKRFGVVNDGLAKSALKVAASPVMGLKIAAKTGAYGAAILYPLLRASYLWGWLHA